MEKFDFALNRARALKPDSELVLPQDFVGECVSNAMAFGLINAPKRGTFGGKISQKALRKLRLAGKQRV